MKPVFGAIALVILFSIPSLAQQTKKYDSLELIIGGSVSAYRSKTLNYYVERNDTLVLLPPSREEKMQKNGVSIVRSVYPYRGLLNYYLHSCPDATSMVSHLKLKDSDLIRLFKRYYECIGEKPSYVEAASARSQFTIGLVTGVNLAGMTVVTIDRDIENANWKTSSTLAVGLNLEKAMFTSKVAFGGQLGFTTYDFTGTTFREDGTQIVTNDFKAKITQLRIKGYFKKYFGSNDFNGFVKIGPIYNFNTVNNSSRIETEYLKGIGKETTEKTDPLLVAANKFNAFVGVGASKKIGKSLYISLDVQIETKNQFNDRDASYGIEYYAFPLSTLIGIHYRVK